MSSTKKRSATVPAKKTPLLASSSTNFGDQPIEEEPKVTFMEFTCYTKKSTRYENSCTVKFRVKSMEGGRVHVCEPDGKNQEHNHIETGTSKTTDYRPARGKNHLLFCHIPIYIVFAPKIIIYSQD